MSKFTDAFKRRAASTETQQKISEKIFYNSQMKDLEGNDVMFPEPGQKYYLHSKNDDKKIGWVKMPSAPGEAGYGWCNLPAYLKMEEPPEIPEEFENEDWDEVNLDDYFNDVDIDEYLELDNFEPDYEEDNPMDDPAYIESLGHSADGVMIDDYMDLQARLDELNVRGDEFAANRDFDAWKENKKAVTNIENSMKDIADQWRAKYPGGEIEDVVNDMRDLDGPEDDFETDGPVED